MKDPVVASWAGTGAFAITTVAALVGPEVLLIPAAVVDVVLFIAGCVVFALALVIAVQRSRTEVIDLSGLFTLTTAPANVRRSLIGSLLAEIGVALAAAVARPATAAGILVPVYGLAMCGVWAARKGQFPPRPVA